MAKVPLEKTVKNKLKTVDSKLKTSFILIRQDVDEMKQTIDAMRKYLLKKDKQYNYAKKEDNKLREEFRKDVDEFTQKIKELNLAFDKVREIQREVVVVKDLARIEDGIKTSFKNEIDGYKEQIKILKAEIKDSNKRIAAIENGYVREKKKVWFFKKKEE
jgi:exonuclease VII large subunit